MDKSTKPQHWYKSPWLLGWLFLVLMAMAGTINMVIQANQGFPGLVVDDFYERSQDYEENIVSKIENNERWKTAFTLQEIKLDTPSQIKFTITDKQGQAAKVDKITLFAYRPADAKQDFSVPMALIKDSKDRYQADITFNRKGKWDLLASVIIAGIEVNYAQKIFVKD
jgi:nitrogen fixation protein FixH